MICILVGRQFTILFKHFLINRFVIDKLVEGLASFKLILKVISSFEYSFRSFYNDPAVGPTILEESYLCGLG